MTVAESLYAKLVSLATSAGTRVYPGDLPLKDIDPVNMQDSITYHLVSEKFESWLDAPASGVCTPLYQVSGWSVSPKRADTLREQFKNGLRGFSGTLGGGSGVNCIGIMFSSGADMRDPETKLYFRSADFFIPYVV